MSIEEDIKIVKQLNKLLKFFRTHGWIPDISREINKNNTIEAIEHLLQDYTRQKQINEEHQKISGELREKVKELENSKIIQDKSIRSGKPTIEGTRLTVIDILLFITEFIKEHEKEFRENYADINTKQIIDSINYLLENSIPKQKIKDKIEELKDENYQISLGSNILLDTQITKNNFKIQVLEELLQEEDK